MNWVYVIAIAALFGAVAVGWAIFRMVAGVLP